MQTQRSKRWKSILSQRWCTFSPCKSFLHSSHFKVRPVDPVARYSILWCTSYTAGRTLPLTRFHEVTLSILTITMVARYIVVFGLTSLRCREESDSSKVYVSLLTNTYWILIASSTPHDRQSHPCKMWYRFSNPALKSRFDLKVVPWRWITSKTNYNTHDALERLADGRHNQLSHKLNLV